MPDKSKNGGKKTKKAENGKGTSSGVTPPPISDTVKILYQTRQMMDNGSIVAGQNNNMNMNDMSMNYTENQKTCQNPMLNTVYSVNNVKNNPCVMPQSQQISPNLGQHFNQSGHVYVPQTPQTFPVGQNCPTDQKTPGLFTDGTHSQSQGYYTSAGAQTPALPPYTTVIYNMFKGLEQSLGQKLVDIEAHVQSQNQRWESVETQLQNQNSRMINTEHQLSQMKIVKESVSNTNTRVANLGEQVTELQSKVTDCEQSIQSYSNLYDDIVTSNTETDSVIKDLLGRVENLEDSQSKSENRITDLQRRIMRENLIFTGIKEPQLPEGEYEDVEHTLRTFLSKDMKIERYMEFDRVHRLGRHDPYKTYPRPIIAKFERYRDKEYVRQAAPDALFNTDYGVREQFPQEIEEKRKLLYPVAKTARQNKENRVRLVRDKLYVNGQEVKVNRSNQEKNSKSEFYLERKREENRSGYGNAIRGRTVYAKRRSQPNLNPQAMQDKPWERPTYSAIPVQNKFSTLLDLGEAISDTDSKSERKATKNKASSPLDKDMTFKKQREGQSDNTDTESVTEVQMTTEYYEGSQENSVNKSSHSSVTSERDINSVISNGVSHNCSDSETGKQSYSDSNMQKNPETTENLSNDQPSSKTAENETY